MKKIYYIFIIILCFLNINIVKAVDIEHAYDYSYENTTIDLSSKHVILYNLTDNYKLLDINSNEKVQVASLTKIMTTIVAIENIDRLDDKVTITSKVFEGINDYSKAGFKVGQSVSYRDLLYGVMLPSGADAVKAIILNVSGSEEEFVKLMNDKVKELKLTNTNFDNAIGMDSKDNYSTASDMAVILNYALNDGEFRKIFTTKKYNVDSINLNLTSTLNLYGSSFDTSFITGAKSGFTDGAGVCLASIATINNVDYLLIVLGSNANNRSNAVRDSIDVYNYFSKNYEYKVLLDSDEVIKKINIKWGKEKTYDIKVNKDINKYVKNTVVESDLNYVYEGVDELKYSIKKGSKLGVVNVIYKDSVIASQDIYLNKDIKYYHPVIYGIMFLAIILMFSSIIGMIKNKKRRKKKRRKRK